MKTLDIPNWIIAIVTALSLGVGAVFWASTQGEHVAEAQTCCQKANSDIQAIKDDLTAIKIDGARTRQLLEDMAAHKR